MLGLPDQWDDAGNRLLRSPVASLSVQDVIEDASFHLSQNGRAWLTFKGCDAWIELNFETGDRALFPKCEVCSVHGEDSILLKNNKGFLITCGKHRYRIFGFYHLSESDKKFCFTAIEREVRYKCTVTDDLVLCSAGESLFTYNLVNGSLTQILELSGNYFHQYRAIYQSVYRIASDDERSLLYRIGKEDLVSHEIACFNTRRVNLPCIMQSIGLLQFRYRGVKHPEIDGLMVAPAHLKAIDLHSGRIVWTLDGIWSVYMEPCFTEHSLFLVGIDVDMPEEPDRSQIEAVLELCDDPGRYEIACFDIDSGVKKWSRSLYICGDSGQTMAVDGAVVSLERKQAWAGPPPCFLPIYVCVRSEESGDMLHEMELPLRFFCARIAGADGPIVFIEGFCSNGETSIICLRIDGNLREQPIAIDQVRKDAALKEDSAFNAPAADALDLGSVTLVERSDFLAAGLVSLSVTETAAIDYPSYSAWYINAGECGMWKLADAPGHFQFREVVFSADGSCVAGFADDILDGGRVLLSCRLGLLASSRWVDRGEFRCRDCVRVSYRCSSDLHELSWDEQFKMFRLTDGRYADPRVQQKSKMSGRIYLAPETGNVYYHEELAGLW